jgi:hypothetical protein
MKKVVVSALLFMGIALSGVHIASAQEVENDKFSFGKVVSVAADQVTVKEYDFAKDADVEVVYSVSAETEFGNVSKVTDLVANDDIVVDYVEKDGKRLITTLVKEEKGAEAPMAGQAGEEAAAPADATALAPAQEQPAAAPAVTEAAPAPEGTAPVQQ